MTLVYRRKVLIGKVWYLNAFFSFCNRPKAYFLLFFEQRDKQEVLQKNLYCLPEIYVCWKNLFLNWRSVILKESNTVNSTTNLSTLGLLTNQSMISESGVMEWRHQRHLFRLCRPFPLFPAHCFTKNLLIIQADTIWESCNWLAKSRAKLAFIKWTVSDQ